MAGRVSAFADPEIIRLAKTHFVPVCADDWYQRRRRDAEGQFWKTIFLQGPRSADAETHQGIYIFTADGELLAFKNAGQDVKATREQLAQGLRKWSARPAAMRRPGAVTIDPQGKLDPNYTRTPPKDGLILRVHTRILDRHGDGYSKGSCAFTGGDRAARDFLWLTAADRRALETLPRNLGLRVDFPPAITMRMLRFHLVDNTRGEPEAWARDQIHASSISVTPLSATAEATEYQIDGHAVLATDRDLSRAERGYEMKLGGRLKIQSSGRITQLELVAIGEHWGAGTFTGKGQRPGRGLLGITFELADQNVPSNRVAPQGARNLQDYYDQE